MTTYTVHLYREMRLVFPGIEAETPDEAARLASARGTYEADHIEDCAGFDYSARVGRDGDENVGGSRIVFLRADGGEIEPASQVSNATRARWAEACVSVLLQHTGCDEEDALGDLLCDLMHWSHQRGFDFALALDRARGHYDAELADEALVPPAEESADTASLLDALLDIKRLASGHDDSGYDPHALLELIERKAIAAVARAEAGG